MSSAAAGRGTESGRQNRRRGGVGRQECRRKKEILYDQSQYVYENNRNMDKMPYEKRTFTPKNRTFRSIVMRILCPVPGLERLSAVNDSLIARFLRKLMAADTPAGSLPPPNLAARRRASRSLGAGGTRCPLPHPRRPTAPAGKEVGELPGQELYRGNPKCQTDAKKVPARDSAYPIMLMKNKVVNTYSGKMNMRVSIWKDGSCRVSWGGERASKKMLKCRLNPSC